MDDSTPGREEIKQKSTSYVVESSELIHSFFSDVLGNGGL